MKKIQSSEKKNYNAALVGIGIVCSVIMLIGLVFNKEPELRESNTMPVYQDATRVFSVEFDSLKLMQAEESDILGRRSIKMPIWYMITINQDIKLIDRVYANKIEPSDTTVVFKDANEAERTDFRGDVMYKEGEYHLISIYLVDQKNKNPTYYLWEENF